MTDFQKFHCPYLPDPAFTTRVAYFSMEYAIHQPLKIYAGGLGYLSGSHLRSAYALKQNLVGVGILWKYGYYDQVRKGDQGMNVLFQEKIYGFLEETNLRFTLTINQQPVQVTAYYLPPEVFGTAPLFLLSTDLPENTSTARNICNKLYDADTDARIGASILLGIGGAKLLELLHFSPDVYHLNESHAIPLAFYLYNKWGSREEVKKRLVFTSHTPEEGGNPRADVRLLDKMNFFYRTSLLEAKYITGQTDDTFNYTLAALRFAKVANGVSRMHRDTLREMWKNQPDLCPIIYVTNAQNFKYWSDAELYEALNGNREEALPSRKKQLKRRLFEEVADQTGEFYDENVLTIVWARRFAGYKRADLLLEDLNRFHRILANTRYPVQIIWAGKPYPMDYEAITIFDRIVNLSKQYSNCSVLIGYELKLSKLLKQGADVWLNTPRLTHEACGTSGMSAAMNGAINLSIPDGWVPEFAKPGVNSFIIPPAAPSLPQFEQDRLEAESLYSLLENTVIPMYYEKPRQWTQIMKNSLRDVLPYFDSDRMAREYYQQLYNYQYQAGKVSMPGGESLLQLAS